MGYSRHDYVKIGWHFVTGLLTEWADRITASARKDLTRLKNVGVTESMLKEISGLSKKALELESAQEASKRTPIFFTKQIEKLHKDSLIWWSKTKKIAIAVFASEPDVLVKFRTAVRVWQSVPRLIEEISRLIPLLKEYQKELSQYGINAKFITQGETFLSKLKEIDTKQEETRKQIPEKTADLYEVRGRLYDSVRKIVRLARAEFIDEPDKLKRYNYDILNRERIGFKAAKTRKAKTPQQ